MWFTMIVRIVPVIPCLRTFVHYLGNSPETFLIQIFKIQLAIIHSTIFVSIHSWKSWKDQSNLTSFQLHGTE
jgi:hypothetical protein